MFNPPPRIRVAAVSYLNTVPLVWGLENGPQRGTFDVEYCLPSVCADRLRDGDADIGLIPIIEMARQGLDFCPGTGIACDGAVRSILLVCKTPPPEIRTLAVDAGSRTSVMLSRVILDSQYGVRPAITVSEPSLDRMLAEHDAALIIGDPALHLDPASLPYETLDLGSEWKRLTGLPMVFAVWSGHSKFTTEANSQVFLSSLRHGLANIEAIAATESPLRGLPIAVVTEYLTRYIRFELGKAEYEGMRTYLRLASELEPALTEMATPLSQ
ncbi:MAG: menaquinone biosynthesis protein [Acidobacteria bacterium]|nr:menaquinone biosynthesis protein [Acidobacteriota bacterium]